MLKIMVFSLEYIVIKVDGQWNVLQVVEKTTRRYKEVSARYVTMNFRVSFDMKL